MAAQVDALEERRARLEALRQAEKLSAASENAKEENEGSVEKEREEPTIKFRNYVPRDENLQQLKIMPPQPLKFEDSVNGVSTDANGREDPIVSIAPKKANWDLRRDVAKKLEKLERRTQRAIIELMQEEDKRRKAAAPHEEDLSTMMV